MTTTAAPVPTVTTSARVGRAARWALQVLLGLFFAIASGAPKLYGDPYAILSFTDIGVGQWLRYVVGVLEVAGGIGLLVPRLAGAAAVGLIGIMIFAVPTQLFLLDTGFWYTPVIVGVLLSIVAVTRRDEVRDLVARRR